MDSNHRSYAEGWNDCRDAMLAAAPTPPADGQAFPFGLKPADFPPLPECCDPGPRCGNPVCSEADGQAQQGNICPACDGSGEGGEACVGEKAYEGPCHTCGGSGEVSPAQQDAEKVGAQRTSTLPETDSEIAARIFHKPNPAMAGDAALLDMLETLCNGLEWNIENHPEIMNESDAEALAQARTLLKRVQPVNTLGGSKADYTRVFNMGRDSVQPASGEDARDVELSRLRIALAYVAFALHGTRQHMLATGITLIDGDTVTIKLNGWKVEGRFEGEWPGQQEGQP